jgi:catechol 2,3-dioxygenase-like lactoylglutathione lyase family enzyme
MSVQSFGEIRQVAYLVDDLEASVERWARLAGVGPWTVYRNVMLTGRYRGQDTTIVMDVGLSYQGDLQLELIRPRSQSPSPYQDASGKTLVGMHHIARFTDDLEATKRLARERGLTVTFEASNPVTHVAYCESPDEPGLLFEFMQASPMLLDGFAQGVVASRGWDGREATLMTIDLGG